MYGKFVKDAIVVTPHGSDDIVFSEIENETSPIVDNLANLAERYSLYPMYIVQEDKVLAADSAGILWYKVDEVKMRFDDVKASEFDQFVEKCKQQVKEIYRNDSVFLKLFIYQDDDDCPYIMAFNSERSPKYRGNQIGVAEWPDAVCKFVKNMNCKVYKHKVVYYANL
jgi:hypothetical protein